MATLPCTSWLLKWHKWFGFSPWKWIPGIDSILFVMPAVHCCTSFWHETRFIWGGSLCGPMLSLVPPSSNIPFHPWYPRLNCVSEVFTSEKNDKHVWNIKVLAAIILMIIWTPSLDVDEAVVWIGTDRKLDIWRKHISMGKLVQQLCFFSICLVKSTSLHSDFFAIKIYIWSTMHWWTWANLNSCME